MDGLLVAAVEVLTGVKEVSVELEDMVIILVNILEEETQELILQV
tara:strand:- start:39 stop:173 length:135 start_codon:yes stop_codon:yes gene_type:complete